MTLREYIAGIEEFVENYPETLDMVVITSQDDEGNGFNKIYYPPSKGRFEDGEFESYENFEEAELEDSDVNAVCVN